MANDKKLKPSELGQKLEPILKTAEQNYLCKLQGNSFVAARLGEAQQKIVHHRRLDFYLMTNNDYYLALLKAGQGRNKVSD